MVWKILSSIEKYKNRFMTVTEDELVTDHGESVTFGIVHKEPAVIVIPWDGEKFTLIGQYRYATDFFSWEFPAGHMEHASVEAAALAELQEETGLHVSAIKSIGTFFVAPGHNTQVAHVFLATGLTPGEQTLEPAEKGMQVKSVTQAELEQMILEGAVKDGLTITSLKLFELQL